MSPQKKTASMQLFETYASFEASALSFLFFPLHRFFTPVAVFDATFSFAAMRLFEAGVLV